MIAKGFGWTSSRSSLRARREDEAEGVTPAARSRAVLVVRVHFTSPPEDKDTVKSVARSCSRE